LRNLIKFGAPTIMASILIVDMARMKTSI